jgi:hypothetical protein
MKADNEYQTQYVWSGKYSDTIRRAIPKIRMSKKERIRRRWEGREEERFNK